ncbi:hypothetical protein FPV67DRAFT_562325 [Lyophyllum atratum]|nr:hypothetical protein FPV67DRAFT_562325 [Lyophyllum atratum]
MMQRDGLAEILDAFDVEDAQRSTQPIANLEDLNDLPPSQAAQAIFADFGPAQWTTDTMSDIFAGGDIDAHSQIPLEMPTAEEFVAPNPIWMGGSQQADFSSGPQIDWGVSSNESSGGDYSYRNEAVSDPPTILQPPHPQMMTANAPSPASVAYYDSAYSGPPPDHATFYNRQQHAPTSPPLSGGAPYVPPFHYVHPHDGAPAPLTYDYYRSHPPSSMNTNQDTMPLASGLPNYVPPTLPATSMSTSQNPMHLAFGLPNHVLPTLPHVYNGQPPPHATHSHGAQPPAALPYANVARHDLPYTIPQSSTAGQQRYYAVDNMASQWQPSFKQNMNFNFTFNSALQYPFPARDSTSTSSSRLPTVSSHYCIAGTSSSRLPTVSSHYRVPGPSGVLREGSLTDISNHAFATSQPRAFTSTAPASSTLPIKKPKTSTPSTRTTSTKSVYHPDVSRDEEFAKGVYDGFVYECRWANCTEVFRHDTYTPNDKGSVDLQYQRDIQNHLVRHIQEAIPDGPGGMYVCRWGGSCGQLCKTPKTLFRHIRATRMGHMPFYSYCPDCPGNVRFARLDLIKPHNRRVHGALKRGAGEGSDTSRPAKRQKTKTQKPKTQKPKARKPKTTVR